jgi:hypothetical protein
LESLQASQQNQTGVTHRCPLLSLPYFDVTTSFQPDIMHDIVEGVIPRLLHNVLRTVVRERKISLEGFNSKLQQASKQCKDRPNDLSASSLTPTGKIVGSAAQKWQLFVMLPELIGDVFFQTKSDSNRDQSWKAWKTYLLLRDVTDIVMSPTVCRSQLSYLAGAIFKFLDCYASVFGSASITPKHHYLTHYPRMLEMFGPLRPLWCFRFEAKHQYFKSVISSLGNYINVTYTMANRHQMRQCSEFAGMDVLSTEPQCLSSSKVWEVTHLPAGLLSAISCRLLVDIPETETITTTNCLQFDHIQYSVGSQYVVTVVETEEIPLFLQVKYIVNFRGIWLLCGRLCFAEAFDKYLHAYKINIDNDWAVMYPGEEADHEKHSFFHVNGNLFASCKYHVHSAYSS